MNGGNATYWSEGVYPQRGMKHSSLIDWTNTVVAGDTNYSPGMKAGSIDCVLHWRRVRAL
jgi:hypothetical protein